MRVRSLFAGDNFSVQRRGDMHPLNLTRYLFSKVITLTSPSPVQMRVPNALHSCQASVLVRRLISAKLVDAKYYLILVLICISWLLVRLSAFSSFGPFQDPSCRMCLFTFVDCLGTGSIYLDPFVGVLYIYLKIWVWM